MKVMVKYLKPNPFRKIKSYPINRDKITALKTSINETTFWDNIVARKHNGKFEIAYGHHRLIALKELGIKEVDIPVRQFDDAMMIKIMANENLDEWKLRPAVLNETVLTAKEFLDSELAKYKSWETSDKFIKGLFDNQRSFETSKGMGIGRDTILKFLGVNYKAWMIQEALDTLNLHNRGIVERKTVETIPTTEQARVFKKAVQDYGIPKREQQKLAKKIVTEGIGKRDIPRTVKQAIPKKQLASKDRELEEIKKELEDIDKQARALNNRIFGILAKTRKMNVIRLKGLQSWFTASSLHNLMGSILKMYDLFGLKAKKLLGGNK